MNSFDQLNQEIERYKRELMGYTSLSEQMNAMRKLASEMAGASIGGAFADSPNQLMEKYEQLQRVIAPFDSIASYTADIQKLTGLTAVQEAERYWNEFSGLATAASSINTSLNSFASKIADDISSGQDLLSQRLELTASQALASSLLRENALADLSSNGLTTAAPSLRLDVASITDGLQASFSLAGLAGTTSIEKAIAAACRSISSEYADQSDIECRLREMVGGMSAFDLARTVAIAQIQGVEGIARQMTTLGLELGDYLEDDGILAKQDVVSTYTQGSIPQVSLEVFQQILISLIAAYIFAIFINPAIPNTDLDTQSKKIERVESLIEKLPQVIEAQVEAIIRRQLLAEDSYFVVRERVARLRTAPEIGASVLALVFPNQKLKVLEERGKWIRVEFYDYLGHTAKEGWILKKYCTRLVQSVDRKHQERELDTALAQTRADMAAGRMVQESPEAHLARLDAMNLAS